VVQSVTGVGCGSKGAGALTCGPGPSKNFKYLPNFEIQNRGLPSKNAETLHEARLAHDRRLQQPSPLSWLQIPTRSHAIKVGTDSSLNIL
jgi:hypothetical protein